MTPNRRKFIIGAISLVGGGAQLAACGREPALAVSGPELTFYTPEEFEFLARLSDLIIPRTETPGALDVDVPGYMDGLMTEWASAARRAAQRVTLTRMRTELDALAAGGFANADKAEAEAVLADYDLKAFAPETAFYEYRSLKQLIETVYASSEVGAIEEYDYQPVPGSWDPAVPLELN